MNTHVGIDVSKDELVVHALPSERGALFPNDTVQSRMPEPGWLERWLDEQIRFDADWEQRVIERILHNLSLLFGRTINTAQELNRYRREIAQRLGGMASMGEQSQAA